MVVVHPRSNIRYRCCIRNIIAHNVKKRDKEERKREREIKKKVERKKICPTRKETKFHCPPSE
jgi:hypothetical protein